MTTCGVSGVDARRSRRSHHSHHARLSSTDMMNGSRTGRWAGDAFASVCLQGPSQKSGVPHCGDKVVFEGKPRAPQLLQGGGGGTSCLHTFQQAPKGASGRCFSNYPPPLPPPLTPCKRSGKAQVWMGGKG
eukprot:364603-Chlamydomonas_euryale.AAC.4